MESKSNEETLLSRLKNDDQNAFAEIYKHYWESLFNHAYRRLNDEELVKELIQDLFVELWQKRHTLDIHTSLGAYLQTAIKYKVFNQLKSNIIQEKYHLFVKQTNIKHDNNIEENIRYQELNTAFVAALVELPKQPRNVYQLRYHQGLSNSEIADSLQLSVSTVEKHMSKAIKYLKSRLKTFLF